MICLKDTNETIGYCSINNIDHQNQKAKYGGISIEKNFGSKGYATEATKMLLDFAFHELNLNMIYGFWRSDHLASLKMAENCGFRKVGVIDDYVFKQGRFYSAYIYRIKRSEYDSMVSFDEKD
jgi:ribosomal-protein-alanine N-acetyltransferase